MRSDPAWIWEPYEIPLDQDKKTEKTRADTDRIKDGNFYFQVRTVHLVYIFIYVTQKRTIYIYIYIILTI